MSAAGAAAHSKQEPQVSATRRARTHRSTLVLMGTRLYRSNICGQRPSCERPASRGAAAAGLGACLGCARWRQRTSGARYAGVVYLRMCSSAARTASVESYEPAQDDALPKSHSTHVPLLCSRTFSALRSLPQRRQPKSAHRRAALTVPTPESHTRAHRCARGGLWWCMTAIALATEWKTVNTSPSLSWLPRSSI